MKSSKLRFLLLLLLVAISQQYAHAQAQEPEATVVEPIEEENDHWSENPSLRHQRRGQNERRLFYWGNLLYAIGVCSGNGGGLCPAPHCHGPPGPLQKKACGSSSGGGGGGGGGSSSGGGSGRSSGGGGGDANYVSDATNSYYEAADGDYAVENSAYEGNDYNELDFSDGVSSQGTTTQHGRRFDFFWYLVAGAAVASLVGVFIAKKRKSEEEEEDDLQHELNQSVAKRMKKLLDGKGVPPIHDTKPAPSFVSLKRDGEGPSLESVFPQMQQKLEEPDEEAIEVKLGRGQVAGQYYAMTPTHSMVSNQ